MAPSHAPDSLPLFPGEVPDPLDPMDALEDPDFSSDEEDAGEWQVGRVFVLRGRGLDEASDEEDEASDEEDEASDDGYEAFDEEDEASDEKDEASDDGYEASDEEASDEEDEASDDEDKASDEEDEADSGNDSLSEEDVSEEEDEDTESEEEDQRLPPANCLLGTNLLQLWRFLNRKERAPIPPPAPCPFFEEERRPGGSRRNRDEDEEEEPISKRPRFSNSEDIEEELTPSTSAGTSGGCVHYFQQLHKLKDSDSD